MKKSAGFFVVFLLWCLPPCWGETGSSFACYLKYAKWMILTGMLTITCDFRYIRHLFSENPTTYRKKACWMSILYDSGEASEGAKQEAAILPYMKSSYPSYIFLQPILMLEILYSTFVYSYLPPMQLSLLILRRKLHTPLSLPPSFLHLRPVAL